MSHFSQRIFLDKTKRGVFLSEALDLDYISLNPLERLTVLTTVDFERSFVWKNK